MGRSRYKITNNSAPHFLTLTVLHWLPVFTRPESVDIILNSLKYLQHEGLKIHAWVVLENHVHLIAQSENLSTDLKRLKSFTAKALIEFLQEKNAKTLLDQLKFYKKAHKDQTEFQFWQEGSHPELIANEVMMRQKIDYVHMNPVKRGYVDLPEHWRYSSARHYLGLMSLLAIDSY